jgi:aspartokinase
VAAADRISAAAQLVAEDPAEQKLVVVSAMGAHPSSPVKVTDLLLNMVAKASQQDQAFLIDLAALQACAQGSPHRIHCNEHGEPDGHCACTRSMHAKQLQPCESRSQRMLHAMSNRRSMWRRQSSCWARAGS